MKRREAKFVHASPRLVPDQIKASAHMRETRTEPTRGTRPKTPRAAASAGVRRRKP